MKEQAAITRRNTLLGATTLAAAAVLGSPMALAPVNAQPVGTPGAAPGTAANEPGKLAPLPDRLPSSVEARVGPVELQRGMPTQKGIEQLFETTPDAQWRDHIETVANELTGTTKEEDEEDE